jgi:hypothetical protein
MRFCSLISLLFKNQTVLDPLLEDFLPFLWITCVQVTLYYLFIYLSKQRFEPHLQKRNTKFMLSTLVLLA